MNLLDGQPQYDILLAETLTKKCDLFKGTDGALYIQVPTPHGNTTYPLHNVDALARVTGMFTQEYQHIYTKSELEKGERQAYSGIIDKQTREVFTRVGKHGSDYYLDLHTQPKRYVKFNAAGWLVTDNVPIHFQEGQGQLPMPEPLGTDDYRYGFTALRNLLTLNDMQFRCLLPMLVNYLLPHLEQPIMVLSGEQKSGKSTFLEIIKTLVDPNTAMRGGDVPDTRDLFIKVSSAWVATFDNLTKIKEEGLNAICTLATGGTFQTRRLYTDSNLVTMTCRNPVILSGISNVARRGDVANRAVLFELKSVDALPTQLTSEVIRERLHECAPSILRALLTLTCYVLKEWDSLQIPLKVRPASFGLIGRAVEKGMGWPKGSFELAYHTLRRPLEAAVLDEYSVMTALIELLETKKSIGRYTQHPEPLLAELREIAPFETHKTFPSAATFGKILVDCAPALREQHGWDYQPDRDWKGRQCVFTYKPIPAPLPEPTPVAKKVVPSEATALAARLTQQPKQQSLGESVGKARAAKKGKP